MVVSRWIYSHSFHLESVANYIIIVWFEKMFLCNKANCSISNLKKCEMRDLFCKEGGV